jgi:hypothetical protein
MMNDMLAQYGVDLGLEELEAGSYGLIPGHSHIIGAWIWSGILGLVFWIFMVWVVLKAIFRVTTLKPRLAPVYTWFLISMFWDIWFSPFASTRRLTEAFLIVVMMDLPPVKRFAVARPWNGFGARAGSFMRTTRGLPAPRAR